MSYRKPIKEVQEEFFRLYRTECDKQESLIPENECQYYEALVRMQERSVQNDAAKLGVEFDLGR